MKNIIYLLFAACIFLFAGCESSTVEKSETPVKPSVQKPAKTEAELEYERATQDLGGEKISIETYELDKKIILEKISELNIIMKDKNYKSWLNYIEKSSIDY